MKLLILMISLALSINTYAQDDKTVTLVVNGQGKTQDEAKQNALRSAIEQAFGTFISSKTEILNDNLDKDEIVSVSNGNIQKFEIISEVQIPSGNYATSLKVTVSVTKLTSFVQSKGVVVEFKGSLFAFNVNQQILNEKNEIKAIKDLCNVVTKLSDTSFEYSIKASDPVAVNASNEKWRIPMYISVSANSNLLSIATYVNQTLKGLSLSIDEANNYIKLGKNVYPISIAANEKEYNYAILRTEKSISNLISQLYYFNHSIQNFKISNGLSEWKIIDYPVNLKHIYDYGFRIFLKEADYSNNRTIFYSKSSVFFEDGRGGRNCNPGIELELREYSDIDWCNFRPKLDYLQWDKYIALKTGKIFQIQSNPIRKSIGADVAPSVFENQFAFVNNLDMIFRRRLFDHMVGLLISFTGITPQKEIVRFYYEDIKTLEEINKISEYKVSPIVN